MSKHKDCLMCKVQRAAGRCVAISAIITIFVAGVASLFWGLGVFDTFDPGKFAAIVLGSSALVCTYAGLDGVLTQ